MKQVGIFADHGSSDDAEVFVPNAFFKLMKYFPNRTLYWFTIFFSILFGIIPLGLSLFMGSLIDSLLPGNDFMTSFVQVIYALIEYFVCFIIVAIIVNYLVPATCKVFITDLRIRLFENLMRQDIEYFDKTSTGVLIGRLTEDVVLCEGVYINKFMNSIQNGGRFFGSIIISFVKAWEPSMISLGAIIICIITFLVCDKIIEKLWEKFYVTASAASMKAEEVFTSFRTVKSFDNEMQEADEYHENLLMLNKVFQKTSGIVGIKAGIIGFVVQAMIGATTFVLSYLIIKKPETGYQPGDLITVMLCSVFAVSSLNLVIQLSDDFQKAKSSASKLLHILELKPNIVQEEGGEISEVKGMVEFRDISFKYPTSEEYAVKNLNFKIKAGETIAIVGESGCGKSTTLQLIQRFYEPESGQILIDDTDIKTLSSNFLRSQVSVVQQTPVLFSMSVKDNIRFAKPKASNQEVADAALIGNAHDFICEMPDGYKSMAQQTSLSGGQKQRICISRAILKNSPILLLDEATAALDTESEQLVQQSIEKVRKGKTAIIVAHRLATVRNADRILVFKEGKVVEEGTHNELLERKGIYADLIKFQLQ